MKTYVKKFLSIASLSLFLCIPSISYAEPQAALTLNPENPSPYSSVTITALSYSFDVNTAMIIWRNGDKILLSGQGEKSLTIKTGGVGTQTTLHVLIETATGISVDQSITITPESVDILYESPESYVPIFYDGLALPSEQAQVHFTAMPQMSDGDGFISPKNIAYSWYANDEFIENVSGAGKQMAIIPLDLLTESTEIKVVARTPDGTTAEKKIQVFPHPVMPMLYDYDDIFGVNYVQTYTNRIEATKDFTLALEPYFLSMNNELIDTPSFDWSLDGLPVTPLGGRILAMHPKENSYGSKSLSISISNSKRRLQKAMMDISLIFDTR